MFYHLKVAKVSLDEQFFSHDDLNIYHHVEINF